MYLEIESTIKIGVPGDLTYIWEMLKTHYPFAVDVYDQRRYAGRLFEAFGAKPFPGREAAILPARDQKKATFRCANL